MECSITANGWVYEPYSACNYQISINLNRV